MFTSLENFIIFSLTEKSAGVFMQIAMDVKVEDIAKIILKLDKELLKRKTEILSDKSKALSRKGVFSV